MFFVRRNKGHVSLHCTQQGSTMFFVRQNEATSRSIVLNTLALAYIETPLISKQDKPKIGQQKKV